MSPFHNLDLNKKNKQNQTPPKTDVYLIQASITSTIYLSLSPSILENMNVLMEIVVLHGGIGRVGGGGGVF